jgi:hypothetical protein
MREKVEKIIQNTASITNETAKYVAAWYREEIEAKDVANAMRLVSIIYSIENMDIEGLCEWIEGGEYQPGWGKLSAGKRVAWQSSGSVWTAWFDEDILVHILGEDEDLDEARQKYRKLTNTLRYTNPVNLR